jgi:hypothetical protein
MKSSKLENNIPQQYDSTSCQSTEGHCCDLPKAAPRAGYKSHVQLESMKWNR